MRAIPTTFPSVADAEAWLLEVKASMRELDLQTQTRPAADEVWLKRTLFEMNWYRKAKKATQVWLRYNKIPVVAESLAGCLRHAEPTPEGNALLVALQVYLQSRRGPALVCQADSTGGDA